MSDCHDLHRASNSQARELANRALDIRSNTTHRSVYVRNSVMSGLVGEYQVWTGSSRPRRIVLVMTVGLGGSR